MKESLHRLLKDSTHSLRDKTRSISLSKMSSKTNVRQVSFKRKTMCTCRHLTSTTCESLSHLLSTVCIRANTCCKTTTTWNKHIFLIENSQHLIIGASLHIYIIIIKQHHNIQCNDSVRTDRVGTRWRWSGFDRWCGALHWLIVLFADVQCRKQVRQQTQDVDNS